MTRRLTQYQLSLILTGVSFLLWSWGLMAARVNYLPYGLVSSLPAVFFVALAVLAIAAAVLWRCRERHNLLSTLQILLLIVSLYLTPLILEQTVRFPAAYQNFGFVDYILRHAHLNAQAVWYHGWPGASILFASLFQIAGISDPTVVMGVFSCVAQVLFLLPLWLVLRSTSDGEDNTFWAFAWVFTLINWTSQEYFSPQSVAFLLFLYVLVTVLRRISRSEASFRHSLLLVLLMAATVVTHFVTAAILLVTLVVLNLVWRGRTTKPAVTLLVLLVTWTLYGSAYQVNVFLPALVSEAFRVDLVYMASFVTRFGQTSKEHSFINNSRLLFTLFSLTVAGVGVILTRRKERFSKPNLFMIGMATAPILLLPVFIYSGEFIIRVFLFMLVPVAYFASQLTFRRAWLIALSGFLIVSAPLHFLTHYGNELVERVPESEISFSNFFTEHTTGGLFVGDIPPGSFKNVEKYVFFNLFAASPDANVKDRLNEIQRKVPEAYGNIYYELTTSLDDDARFILADPDRIPGIRRWIEDGRHFVKAFESPDVQLYVWPSAEPD